MSATATEPLRITRVAGACLDFNLCRFGPGQANGSLELWTKLALACGRAEMSDGGYSASDTAESAWRTPRDLPAAQLAALVAAVEVTQGRHGLRFALDAPSDLGIHDALDCHYASAQRRKQRDG